MKFARVFALIAIASLVISLFLFARVLGCSDLGCVVVAPASLCMFIAVVCGATATLIARRVRKRGSEVFHA